MSFLRHGFFPRLLMIMFAMCAFAGAAHAQFTVSIAVPTPSPATAQTGQFTVSATVSGNANAITKVVFYRNDIPTKTDTTSLYEMSQDQLGQDTYTYRARAYDSTGVWVDSSDVKLTVKAKQVIRMGDTTPVTTLPAGRYVDHTAGIQNAVTWLGNNGGGILFFPCTFPDTSDLIALYNIKATINVPSNVTLQGESAEDNGRCRIYWNDVSWIPTYPIVCQPNPSPDPNFPPTNRPMFKVAGGKSGVRFKDLSLYSRTTGPNCPTRSDFAQIEAENLAAIELNTGSTGDINDVIVENVSISHFKHGIRAISDSSTSSEIRDIKIRAYRPLGNHRQLYINAKYAYNWDVQNLNINHMMETQGAVEIVNAGKPATPVGENTIIKFLQVNCNATRSAPPAFCVQVEKHGGLYFRQLHHEGTDQAIIVKDISASTTTATTNPDPIVFEHSVATGTFNDASMKLYLIGNAAFAAPEIAVPGLDSGRLRFVGGGLNSTVVDCGDIHWDITITNPDYYSTDPPPQPTWDDLGMYFTHAERNRGSFFAQDGSGNKFIKAHTICPQGVSGLANINEVGGEYFDSGVMPTEAAADTDRLYSNVLTTANVSTKCPSGDIAACLEDFMDYIDTTPNNGGSVYLDGNFTVTRTVTIPRGAQIAGAPNAQLVLAVPSGSPTNVPLLKIVVPILTAQQGYRASGIVVRNLKLSTSQSGATGLEIVNEGHASTPGPVGASSDMHFGGLTFDGFAIGFDARPYATDKAQPMIDGLSLKNIQFANNQTAVHVLSANASNWNVMNLKMTSSSANAIGWDQKGGGHQSLQNVTCQGLTSQLLMSDCIKLSMSGSYLAGVKQTGYVTNALTIWESVLTNLVVRDSDFRSSQASTSRVNIRGRAFIVSMNNKYNNFDVQTPYPYTNEYLYRGDYSRVTYCGDTYDSGIYSGLATRHPNLITGAPTLTRVPCGTRPIPWDDAIRLGGTSVDKPLVGNFFHDVREDFVIYRDGPPNDPTHSYFLIKQAGGTGNSTIQWGLKDDIGMIGRFFPNTRAQIVIWRPSTGDFWAYTPQTDTYFSYHWGATGDIPFVGNFFDESSSGNSDEVAVYRPSENKFYISNPRSTEWWSFTTAAADGSTIQVGDFLGVGYDQIARYKAGVWTILDPRNPTPLHTAYLGATGDIPVAGKYLSGPCTQLGVWRPTVQPGSPEPNHSQFMVKDPFSSCGTRDPIMIWGSNNDFGSEQFADDIPLTISTADGSLRRPTAYRPTTGKFPYSLSNGQWWVHDPF